MPHHSSVYKGKSVEFKKGDKMLLIFLSIGLNWMQMLLQLGKNINKVLSYIVYDYMFA